MCTLPEESSMEEHVYRTPVTAPHFKILENYYTPNHSTNVLLLSSNFRELASTEPSAMCSKQTAFANCIQRCQWHTVFCTMEINLQWNQVAAFLAGNIDALSTLKNRHRQNDESSEKSKKNDDEKLDKGCIFLKQAMQKWKTGQSRWQALNIKIVVAKTSCVSKQLSLQQRHFGWGSVSMRVGCSLRDGELVPERDMRVQGRGLQAEPEMSEHKTSKENSTWKFITFFHR